MRDRIKTIWAMVEHMEKKEPPSPIEAFYTRLARDSNQGDRVVEAAMDFVFKKWIDHAEHVHVKSYHELERDVLTDAYGYLGADEELHQFHARKQRKLLIATRAKSKDAIAKASYKRAIIMRLQLRDEMENVGKLIDYTALETMSNVDIWAADIRWVYVNLPILRVRDEDKSVIGFDVENAKGKPASPGAILILEEALANPGEFLRVYASKWMTAAPTRDGEGLEEDRTENLATAEAKLHAVLGR